MTIKTVIIDGKSKAEIIRGNNNEKIVMDWSDFWEICRMGRTLDVTREVECFVSECEDIEGYDVRKVFKSKKLLNAVTARVIARRDNAENSDDIYYTIRDQIRHMAAQESINKAD